jgi:DNA mismatch repair protein MSH4
MADIKSVTERYELQAKLEYDTVRRYWLRVYESDFDGRTVPDILVNQYRKKGYIECQTLDLMKLNQRIEDSHKEVVLMSDQTVQKLLDDLRGEISNLFRVCESIAMLDLIAAFGQLATTNKYGEYVRPELTDCLVVKSGRHPVREVVRSNLPAQSQAIANHSPGSQGKIRPE